MTSSSVRGKGGGSGRVVSLAHRGPSRSGEGSADTRERRAETVARKILHYVSNSRLEPGTQLPAEGAMIAEFKVARSTIREALRILEFNGLIKIRLGTGGGPVIVRAEPRELGRVMTLYLQASGSVYEHLIIAQRELEPIMARLAAASSDQSFKEELAEILRREPPRTKEDLPVLLQFHRCIARAPGNPIISILTSALQEIGIYKLESHSSAMSHDRIPEDHLEIGSAILEGREAEAERLMRDHFSRLLEVPSPRELRKRIEWV